MAALEAVAVVAVVVVPSGEEVAVVVVVISTTKTPPVAGCRATSPRETEKVERSSWAYWDGVNSGGCLGGVEGGVRVML